MFTVLKDDGQLHEISFDELRGDLNEDGRFHVKLKDGSEGILLRKAELDELEAERQRGIDSLDTVEMDHDPRPHLQRLFEDFGKE